MKSARWAVLGLLATSILVLAFALGYVTRGGGSGSGSSPTDAASKTETSDSDAATTDFKSLNQIYKLLQDKYVDPDLVDRQTLYQAAITGLLQTFPDSGTYYVDPRTVKTSIGLAGKFDGIGATVASQNGQIVIVSPIEDTPAQRAGLKGGDVILEVDGESTEGWTSEKAVLRIRGPRGTTVKLKVRHADGPEETLDIERDEISIQSVTTQPPGGTLKDGAGDAITDLAYIHIREFDEPTAAQMKKALQDAVSGGKKGIILDLRNNPGGLLRTTYDIADEFLDDGKLILTERERDGTEKQYKSHAGGAALTIPVVIIMNRFSASGSEVLASALHDNNRTTIVGEKSFGKGTVNTSYELSDGGELYISVAKWLTPNGTQIEGVGIRPDVTIALSDEDVDLRRDVQLFKAIDVLRGTNTTPVETPQASTVTPAPGASPTQTGG
jgi:carboxyl-terminal processing protease